MKLKHILFYTTTFLEAYYTHGHCIDIHSHIVSQGLHYVPGTNPCTLCICDKGSPKWCKSVLCSPPQNCKSFQVGNSCCEFKCLDDILSGHDTYKETYDVALRFIASTVTAVLSISLLFFLYNRLKRNKLLTAHNHQRDDQRSLSNVGYIAGNFGYTQHNLGYLGSGNNELEIRYEETSTNFSLWKPPGDYLCGEAPPPYEEAMRSAQNEIVTNQINNTVHSTLINSFASPYPQEINPAVMCRHEEPIPAQSGIPNISSNTHQYVNIRVQHNDNIKKIENAPKKNDYRDKPEASYENLKVFKENTNRPTSSGFNKSAYHKGRSRDVGNSSKASASYETSLPATTRYSGEYSYKIKLSEPYESSVKSVRTDQKKTIHRTLPKNLRELLSNVEKIESLKLQSTSAYEMPGISSAMAPGSSRLENMCSASSAEAPSDPVLEKREKEPKNLVTYQSLSQDEEDYRSECENCKSVVSTIADDDGEAINETMSLQRRPLSESGYELCYRTSLTLPTNTRKQRSYPTTNREKWFSSMQQSSSEESD